MLNSFENVFFRSIFSVADESELFRITIAGYSGTAGDALVYPSMLPSKYNISGMPFSTTDRDNDR